MNTLLKIRKRKEKFRIKHWALMAPFMMLLFACEERFNPVIDARYNEVLVVDGMITSGDGPYTVELSWSTTLLEAALNPATGFEVRISDDQGNLESLTETSPGTYVTEPDGIQGIPGRSYRLELHSPDGRSYRSDFETMQEPVAIDELYPELEYSTINSYPYNLPGYRFYIDATGATSDSSYFMWHLEETYKYESDFKIFFSYYDGVLHEVNDRDTLKTCWKTNKVPGYYLMSTAELQIPEITHFPLHYVTTDNRKLSIRYSLLAKQFMLTREGYEFVKSTTEQNTQGGELYTRQFYQVRGNVYNPNDPDESVFGYFYAAGVSQKRIYTNKPEPPVKMYYSECFLSATDFEMYGWMFLGPPPPASDPLYVTQSASGQRALPVQSCLNCMLRGGKTEKPDFWIDN